MRISIGCAKWWLIGIVATTYCEIGNRAVAQIVPDNTLGTESSVVTPNVDIKGVPSDRIDGGAIRGANVFHSFQEFNVGEGRGAYFSNPAGIENILTRVTGTNASNIFGKLGVLGNANLFLLNPNGIIFGPNASLDISGSFVGTTANSLNFVDGVFSATNPTAPPLLTVKVPLGVQFPKDQPRAIVNSGNLSAGTGQNLTLLGGTVVSTGQLSAPGGQVGVAAVPSGSVAKLNSSAQLLNIDVPSPEAKVASGSSASLTDLLVSNDGTAYPGLTVNSNGQVELLRSGLPVVDGDVVARNVTAQSATLSANHNLTLVESQLGTTGNLNLLAGDTVRVRDSVASPFVAQAGGNLTIQGNKGIDILALNHPQTPFVSGGNLSLISDGSISGDAHFISGSQFSIFNLAGQPGNFFSLYDPIISANGDVQFGNYTGAALKVESTGRIIGGNITINGSDTTLAPNPNDPDVDILRNSRSVILRAGLPSLIYANNIPTLAQGTNFNPSGASPSPPGSIQVGNIDTSSSTGDAGSVILSAIGSIATGSINSRVEGNSVGRAGDITLEAGGTITTGSRVNSDVAVGSSGRAGNINIISRNGDINTSIGNVVSTTGNERGGDIFFEAFGNVTTAGVLSFIGAGGSGDGGNITLTSRNGSINTKGKIVSSTPDGTSGDIRVQANGNITIENEIASRILEAGAGRGTAGRIQLTSDDGNINLVVEEETPAITQAIRSRELIREITSSTPNGTGGNIELKASNGSITTTEWTIRSESKNGVAGDVTLTARDDIRSGNIESSSKSNVLRDNNPDDPGFNKITLRSLQGSVLLNEVKLSTANTGSSYAGNIEIDAAKNVEINESKDIISNGYFGIINIKSGSNVFIKNSTLTAQAVGGLPEAIKEINPQAGDIQVTSQNGKIDINNSFLFTSTGSEFASAGNIELTARRDAISITNGSNIRSRILNSEPLAAGNIEISTDQLTVENSEVTVSSELAQAGNLNIYANKIFLNKGTLRATTGSNRDEANIFLLGLDNSPLDLLHLQNESLIEANARNSATGGNITINTRLLLALPPTGPRGSDITANALRGEGGKVRITARPLGIYGIEFRPETTPLNDITASSETGPAGIVSIRLPDVDPRRGLIQLPEDLGDSSRLIDPSCPVGGKRARSRFVVTGRGGLPPSPSSVINSDILLGESGAIATPPENNSPAPIVEAQGVKIGPKGEIILAANPSQLSSSYSPWQPFTRGCYEK